LLDDGPFRPSRLAWYVEARRIDHRHLVWVDALTGAVLLHFDQQPSARHREVYDADSGSSLPGALVRSEGEAAVGDTDVDLAYDYAGDTYDYYLAEHGRDSYDGAGASLVSSIDYCPDVTPPQCPYQNAFWSSAREQMVYGDTYASADDVVAHELTHAVTERTANLFYYMQSGALNEAFSDIFGETVDLTNGAGSDDPGDRWLMGEDLPIGAIRDMEDPGTFGDPARLGDANLVCATPGGDGGGVHTNSGVANHAYALMVDGGSFNGQTVTGIGLDKAGAVHYRVLTQYLVSSSDFQDYGWSARQACSDLVGVGGITTGDCDEVDVALLAVEVDDPYPCWAAQSAEPPLCPAGSVASDLYFDDFESGASDWSTWNTSGSGSRTWFISSDFTSSGSTSLYGPDYDTTDLVSVGMTVDVAIPAGGASLRFDHSFGFEDSSATTFWDGGQVIASLNEGASWTDIGSLISAGVGYVGTISSGDTNPLGGQSAFVADSFGYTISQLDLSSLSGEQVRFGFRIGSDSVFNDYGWYVDDVHVFECLDTYILAISKIGAGAGTVTSSPAGIDCGSDCSEPYVSGTEVTLTGEADPGSSFNGFSGPADCSDGVVTVSSDVTCTATFSLLPDEIFSDGFESNDTTEWSSASPP
jgi:hypothetical protein